MTNCDRLIPLLWAKNDPRKTLLGHMIETGATAKILVTEGAFTPIAGQLARLMHTDAETAAAFIAYVASIHDIGKAHPAFCSKDDAPDYIRALGSIADISNVGQAASKNFRHELYSQRVIGRILKSDEVFTPQTARYIGKTLALHHQGKHGSAAELPSEWKGAAAWFDAQKRLETLLRQTFFAESVRIDFDHIDASCTLLLGIVILADWIASNEYFADMDMSIESTGESGDERALLEACRQHCRQAEDAARRFIKLSGLANAALPDCRCFTDTWPAIPAAGMRPLQRVVDEYFSRCEKRPIALLIEAPMGEGKTEAGVYAALRMAQMWDKDGFYIGLPTAATSNQMVLRMNALLHGHGLADARLLHAASWMVDRSSEDKGISTEDEAEARAWTMPARRGLLTAYAVGTVDQAMLAALAVKYGVLRLTGLAAKVLLIDEIHAYDAYMSSIILKLLQWCKALCIPVVMMSATLPNEKKAELMSAYSDTALASSPAYPAVTAVYGDGAGEVIPVSGSFQKGQTALSLLPLMADSCDEAIAQRAMSDVASGGCLCVLVNTVKRAQNIFVALRRLDGDCTVMLFHSRFSANRREEIEKACVSLFGKDKSLRPKKAILVATQVVEQSMDLDFDRMITELAPIDLLLQRMGRLHRHCETKRPAELSLPVLEVLVPEGDGADADKKRYGGSGAVYPPFLLQRTERLLKGVQSVSIPEDIPRLVERVYHAIPMGEMNRWAEEYLFKNALEVGTARQYELPKPNARTFSLSQGEQVFDDDESLSFLSAKTRLGQPSVRLALAPSELYERVRNASFASKDLAKEVIGHSVSVSEAAVKAYLTLADTKGRAAIAGEGLLRGVYIFASDDGKCTLHNSVSMFMDKQIGFIIEKGDSNEV